MARPKGSRNKPKTPEDFPLTKRPAKKAPKAAKAAKPAKAAAPGIGHNSTEDAAKQECFLAYRDKLRPLLARLEKAQKDVADTYAQAKKDKIPKKLFAVADKLLGTKKQEDGVIASVKDTLWVARAVGHSIGQQMDLFADAVGDGPSTISAEAEGAQAYRDGKPFRPPYDEGTVKHAEFAAGFYGEQEKATRKGIKPLPEVQGRREGPAAPPPDEWGDEDQDPSRPLN